MGILDRRSHKTFKERGWLKRHMKDWHRIVLGRIKDLQKEIEEKAKIVTREEDENSEEEEVLESW